ncbi:hypothetical protein [Bradyrhizobium sp. RT4b]|uniref:hypothetical protein n=1 Tax=unclassified Bradyrhizobium TaxID=2631580 RepID=UPI003396A051
MGLQFRGERGQALDLQGDVHSLGMHVDPLDEQLDNARLFCRKQFLPKLVEPDQRAPDFGFADVKRLFA